MKTPQKLLAIALVLFISSSACGFLTGKLDQVKELSTAAANMKSEVMPSLEAQMTELAPTLQAAAESLPTMQSDAQKSFTDFDGVPSEVMQQVMERFKNLKSYRMQLTTKKDGQDFQMMDYEVVTPNKYHITIQSDGNLIEQIIIDDVFYMKTGETWMKLDLPPGSMGEAFDFYNSTENLSDLSLIGPDTVDGTPAMVFGYSSNIDSFENKGKVWIGLLDGYVIKFESEYTQDSVTYLSTGRYFDFDADITIEPPL